MSFSTMSNFNFLRYSALISYKTRTQCSIL